MSTASSRGATSEGPIRMSLGYKVQWGIAAVGTSFLSGTYGALLPIFYVSEATP